MRTVRRTAGLLFVIAGLCAGTAGVATAAPPPPVGPHQHYLILPDGTQLPVGPTICSNPANAQGFYGFHQNIHLGTPNNFAFDQDGNPVDFRFTGCP
jgi:hypothetical protein